MTPTPHLPPPPPIVRVARGLIQRIPRGRYRVAHLFADRGIPPFRGTIRFAPRPVHFACDLRDIVAREAYLVGSYEPQETLLVEAFLRSGDFMVDVGANWGYFTLLAARAVGRDGRVRAYEPDPRNVAALGTNLGLNGFSHVELREVAVAAAAGTATFAGFSAAGGNFGTSRLAETAAGSGETYQVETVRLADELGDCAPGAVRLLKMDIEGGEALALDGAREIIGRRVPQYVLIELHPDALRAMGRTADSIEAGLREAGYQGWQVDHRPEAHRRAGRRSIGWRDLIAPLDAASVDPWPHHLWVAPGVNLP